MQKFFPQLDNRIYFENSGGTQVPIQVINNVTKFIQYNYVQPGGFTIKSRNTENIVKESKDFVNKLINNEGGKIVFSSSASQIALNISKSIIFRMGDEIVLTNFSHESAIGCFERLDDIKIKWWEINKNFSINYQNLFNLINDKTRLVVIPHVSNIIGNIMDVKMIIKEIRKRNKDCKIYVDGVAYLAHGLIDVNDWDVDFYVFSFYKFLGLRISVVYIKNEVIKEIQNLNHYFIVDEEKKLEIGGIQYEQCCSLTGIKQYLCDLSGDEIFSRETIIKNYNFFIQRENNFIEYFDKKFKILSDNSDLKLITDFKNKRVPIFSIYSKEIPLDKVCLFLNKNNIECKTGNFYCQRLLNYLDIDNVLRISLLHYNSINELEKFFSLMGEFKKNKLNLYEYDILKNNFSSVVKESFEDLLIDKYYNNIRYRRFSLLKVYGFESIGESSFIQSKKYNKYLGNSLRLYKNIDDKVLNDETFQRIIKKFISKINNSEKSYDYLYVHQIRVEVKDEDVNAVPEGIHQDGYDYICISCVNKNNIEGPENEVLDLNYNIVYKNIMESGDSIILNDRKYYHNVTKLKKISKGVGFRDIFVFTTIS